MHRLLGILAVVAVLAASVAYSLFAHHLSATDDRSEFGYVFALASLYLVALGIAWGSSWRRTIIITASIAVLLGWGFRDTLFWDPRWVYLLEHAGVNASLAALFGLSLASPRGALITRMALAVHGVLPPEIVRYTRQVTGAWTVFFVLVTTASIVLFFWGDPLWWSVLVNILSLPLVALMFIVEYAVRRFRFPDFEHKSIVEGIRAYGRIGNRGR
jgi:uncharacterized membrane protein